MKKKRYWSEAERAKVLDEYGLKTSNQLADELGRTAWSVRSYIKRINDARKWSRVKAEKGYTVRGIRGAEQTNSAAK